MSDYWNNSQVNRVNSELQQLRKLEQDGGGYSLHIDDEDISKFFMTVMGPAGTPYEGGHFLLKFYLPRNYPNVPPKVGFATPIYHPNITEDGVVCYELLKEPPHGCYESNVTLVSMVLSMQVLMANPNYADPLNLNAVRMLRYDPILYDIYVRDMVQTMAGSESIQKYLNAPFKIPIDELDVLVNGDR